MPCLSVAETSVDSELSLDSLSKSQAPQTKIEKLDVRLDATSRQLTIYQVEKKKLRKEKEALSMTIGENSSRGSLDLPFIKTGHHRTEKNGGKFYDFGLFDSCQNNEGILAIKRSDSNDQNSSPKPNAFGGELAHFNNYVDGHSIAVLRIHIEAVYDLFLSYRSIFLSVSLFAKTSDLVKPDTFELNPVSYVGCFFKHQVELEIFLNLDSISINF